MDIKKFNISLIIVLIIILISGGIGYFYFFKKIEESAKTPEEIEIAAIKAGKTKMTGGKVVSVDHGANRFALLILRPSGKYEEYIVRINKNTEFLFLLERMERVGEGEEEEIEVTTEKSPASFDALKSDNSVNVYFENRVDLDSDRLTAKTVEIVSIVQEVESEIEQ